VEKTGHFNFSDCYFNFLFLVELPCRYGSGFSTTTGGGQASPQATSTA
jgi:hypothetical protein